MQDGSISIRNLAKSYPAGNPLRRLFRSREAAGQEVLHGISLEIAPGEVFGLLGPNGAGKTTLVEILATLLLPSGGEARVGGHDVVSEAALVRMLTGYCPSTPDSFYPRLNAVENLEFFALLDDLTAAQADAKITSLLDLVGLDQVRRVAFQKLSQGMKQRLALARALLTDPPVLLLDEPSKSLDPRLQIEIWRFLRDQLAKQMGKTILLVTHSLAEAESVCDRLAILNEGRIVSIGSVGEVKQSLGSNDLAAAFERAVESPPGGTNGGKA
ncbi:MAG: ABC transporter ATP-binding protein [Acidobacteria bacterium]|nr:ABC transporter ATP-binding protein [Acidobacteriota bacterium]